MNGCQILSQRFCSYQWTFFESMNQLYDLALLLANTGLPSSQETDHSIPIPALSLQCPAKQQNHCPDLLTIVQFMRQVLSWYLFLKYACNGALWLNFLTRHNPVAKIRHGFVCAMILLMKPDHLVKNWQQAWNFVIAVRTLWWGHCCKLWV